MSRLRQIGEHSLFTNIRFSQLPMPMDQLFWILLIVKVAVTAGFVVVASLITERAGPVIGALVSTLPLSAGPGYVFLALDHDAAFIAASAKTSLVLNAATCVFALAFAATAQRHRLRVSLSVALFLWFSAGYLSRLTVWSTEQAILCNVIALTVCITLARRFASERMPVVVRCWYDAPLRASMAACLVALLVILSRQVGPELTGIIAVFPVVLTSLILILQPRIGGPAAASVIANSLSGLVGFAVALAFVHLSAVDIGKWTALLVGLAIAVSWNLALWALWYTGVAARFAIAIKRLSPR